MKLILLTMTVSSLFTMANRAPAQTWTLTGADTNLQWGSIACSANGSRLAATVFAGGIYVSTNSGSTWTLSGAPNTNSYWAKIVSSADGLKLAASDYYLGYVYTSADGGTTWTSNFVSDQGLNSLASSADGTRLAAASGSSNVVYLSTDSGVTWNQTILPVLPYGISVASSADGSKLAAATYEAIFTSRDSGATWQMSGAPTNQYWNSIASSADGTRLVAGGNANAFGVSQDGVFTSTDSGATWVTNNIPELGFVPLVAASADGTTLMAVPTDFSIARAGLIFISINSGNTWVEAMAPDASWGGIACSADGSKLFGAAHSEFPPFLDPNENGGIYISLATPGRVLSLSRSAGKLVVSWVISSANFTLQQNTGLDPEGWTDVPTPPVPNLADYRLEVPVSPTNARTFYRLRIP
jgi:photosystem II stability/assembly factor-like uncharacterized protein